MKRKYLFFIAFTLILGLALFQPKNVDAAVGEWIGDYCTDCGSYSYAGLCDQVKKVNVGLFRVSFYLNGEKLGSSVNISSSEIYQELAANAKWHWGDGKTDIISYASGTSLGRPASGGLDTIIISGLSVKNVQTKLSPKKSSKNVQTILNAAGIKEFKFENGKIIYTPPAGECDGDYEIQMIVEAMQVINWLCTSDGKDNHRWIGTAYELNNGLLAQGYDSHKGGNGYMSGSVVDKTLLSALRLDENVTVGSVTFTSVADCLDVHIRGYSPSEGYGMNIYNLTGEFVIECDMCKFDPENPEDFNTECCNDLEYLDAYYGYKKQIGEEDTEVYCCNDTQYLNYYVENVTKKNGNTAAAVYKNVCKICVATSKNDCCYCDDSLDPYPHVKSGDKIYSCNEWLEISELCQEWTCPLYEVKSSITTGYCTVDNSHNETKLIDGAFSASGQFPNYTYEDLVGLEDLTELAKSIANDNNNNTFLAAFHNDPDGFYWDYTINYADKKDVSYEYCPKIVCQEITEIQLPDNLPYVNAGRYFYWDVADTGNLVVEKKVQLCAMDIDIDKFIQKYKKIVAEYALIVANVENMQAWEPNSAYVDNSCPGVVSNVLIPGASGDSDIEGCATASVGCCKSDCPMPGAPKYISDGYWGGEDGYTWIDTSYWTTQSEGEYQQCLVSCENQKDKFKNICIGYKDKYVDIFGTGYGKQFKKDVENLIAELKNCYDVGMDINIDEQYLDIVAAYETYFSDMSDNYFSTITGDIDVSSSNVSNEFAGCYPLVGDCDHAFTVSEKPLGGNNGCDTKNYNYLWNDTAHLRNVLFNGSKMEQYGKMLYGSNYIHGKGWYYPNGSTSKGNALTEGTIDFNSIRLFLFAAENDYSISGLKNICICKDGTVADSIDGDCEDVCPEPEKIYEIITDISEEYYCKFEWKSYYVMENGNFSAEFMNPSGLYPLKLDYSNIGFNGHFSTMLAMGKLRDERCDLDGTCHYSDETNQCMFYIDNELLLDDGGVIEKDICPDGNCDDVCPDGDCSDLCEDDNCDDMNKCQFGFCSENDYVGGMEIIYRQVDLDNPFPDRTPGANWLGQESLISNNRNVEGNKLYGSADILPLYSITMTPATIKAIRKLNQDIGYDYADISTLAFKDGGITGGASSILRGGLMNAALTTGGTFSINISEDERFTDIDDAANTLLDCHPEGVIE